MDFVLVALPFAKEWPLLRKGEDGSLAHSFPNSIRFRSRSQCQAAATSRSTICGGLLSQKIVRGYFVMSYFRQFDSHSFRIGSGVDNRQGFLFLYLSVFVFLVCQAVGSQELSVD